MCFQLQPFFFRASSPSDLDPRLEAYLKEEAAVLKELENERWRLTKTPQLHPEYDSTWTKFFEKKQQKMGKFINPEDLQEGDAKSNNKLKR